MLALSSLSVSFAATGAMRTTVASSSAPTSVQMANIEDLPGAGIEFGYKVFDPLKLSDLCPYGSKEFEWMRTAEVIQANMFTINY